ncbi:unnamed protein product [Nippostrongylus brasiliensis]|uniref:Uncharacterized protein n=1 Tax=Nippostrongylus brasiliensis TaxID=27835 RepID=A0A0N4YFF6_NIPBR|nr:hypothetical protein Q1695_003943 [Nippostrongylus brasiliensis]VDL77375.1 unnamed protein product [Nippostrongylus brasiliensis]VDL79082.1 unnamed protein product [Nippostrongylus brasiliensis]
MATKEYFVPSEEVMTSIVLPTIIFCIGMVVAMLVGINKCKQWELDKIVEMRRTRRVVQRITARLREKNFKTIQNARNMRKRAAAAKAAEKMAKTEVAPPVYSPQQQAVCGTSPPPSYEDALLDEYYYECLPSTSRVSHSTSGGTTNTRRASTQSRASRRSGRASRRTSRSNTHGIIAV